MKYMLLVHHHEASFAQLSEGTKSAMLDESVALTHTLLASGQYLSASPLHQASSAAIVRVREGTTQITDGPFAETHEQIAGYFLVKASDLNDAIRIAARVPGARIGTVEVRPVRAISGLPEI